MAKDYKLLVEYITDELASMTCCLLNGDYCTKCWKFGLCSQVPFNKSIFHPCKALQDVEEDIHKLLDSYETDAEKLYQDLLDMLVKTQDENDKLKEENEKLKKRIAILEKGSNDPKSKIGK